MASKYDTNPLDPDFPKKAGHSQQTEFLPNLDAETKAFSASATARATADEPTRRYDNPNFAQYSSAYAEPQGGPMYQTTRLSTPEKPTNRKIVGLPENLLMIAPYAPFSIGLIAGILELLFVPQSESKVRFHAAQGLAAHIAILLVYVVLGVIGEITNVVKIGSFIFGLVTTIFLVVTMIRIWKGKAAHFESLDGLTNWLNDKIKTQPKQ
ncbi:MAG TPA: hypothetical protein VGO50_07750 [Pyrinomonadaceae bacterium]|jgi:uncharacterized membrane protein|nr:hypothetical protein [Pyrinomonadaceae bacterium]